MRQLYFWIIVIALGLYVGPRIFGQSGGQTAVTPKVSGGQGGAVLPLPTASSPPNGSLLYFRRQASTGQLVLRDLSKKTEAVVLSDRSISEVSPVGSEVLIVRRSQKQGAEISRFSPVTKTSQVLLTINDPGPQVLPRLSPDGRALAYLGGGGRRLEIVDLKSGRPVATQELDEAVSSIFFAAPRQIVLTVGPPPQFTLGVVDLATHSLTKISGIIGGTIGSVSENEVTFASFDGSAKISKIVTVSLKDKKVNNTLTSGPFDDFPLKTSQGLVFHRVIGEAKRSDQLILLRGATESVLTTGLQALSLTN